MHFRHFPVAMGRFFHWGFEELGHEVYTVGPYSRGRIPWGDFYYPDYKFPPNYETPEFNFQVKDILKRIPFKPDIIVQAADTIWLEGESPIPNVILATDPHVIDYSPRLEHASHVFYMQYKYKPKTEPPYLVPYAYDHNIHIKEKREIKYDVVMSGLQYEHRVKAIEEMKKKGLNVFNTLGLIYEDYVHKYNEGKIAFVYPSKEDVPARFWEGLAMGRMVLSYRVSDIELFGFKDGVDYVGFSSIEEAVEKALYYSTHDAEREKIAEAGWLKVRPHTYVNRCKMMLSVL